MPNHIHGILMIEKPENQKEFLDSGSDKLTGKKRFQNQGKNTISSIVGSYKFVCTKHINKDLPSFAFGWQERFWNSIIKDEEAFSKISQYIINNPMNWNDDMFSKDEDLSPD